MDKVKISKLDISGVNNPLLQIMGTFQGHGYSLEFLVDGKKVKPKEEMINELLFFEYKILLNKDSQKVKIYLVHNDEKELLCQKKTSTFKRKVHKLVGIIHFQGLKDKEKIDELRQKLKSVDVAKTAKELEIGEMTLADIISELSKPGRDPREDMPKPILRSDVLKLEDLKEGMILTGTVRNVIDFGAFVDIGVKHDGLVHISEMSEKFIKNPSEIVSVGDIVKVKVIKIDLERQKVGLSMKV